MHGLSDCSKDTGKQRKIDIALNMTLHATLEVSMGYVLSENLMCLWQLNPYSLSTAIDPSLKNESLARTPKRTAGCARQSDYATLGARSDLVFFSSLRQWSN